MDNNNQESLQWLSLTEETLFLHDGLIRVTDIVELPREVTLGSLRRCGNSGGNGSEKEAINFESKNPSELADKLISICGNQNSAYARLIEYRLNALLGLWGAQQQLSLGLDEQTDRDLATQEETISVLKKQGLWKDTEQASFSTRVGLLLVLPLLQSQSNTDSALCGMTADVLLNCLRDSSPLSLAREPSDCMNGLENLICSWLGEGMVRVPSTVHQETTASALIALACARGHLKTFVRTVYLLQNVKDFKPVPVSDVLIKLLELDGGPGPPSCLQGSKHIISWGFDDMLSAHLNKTGPGAVQSAEKDKGSDFDGCRSCTTDGEFLYTTNNCGMGLAKIGTGLHGTLRGYVYQTNTEIGPGFVAYGSDVLLYRPTGLDKDKEGVVAQILDQRSLLIVKQLVSADIASINGHTVSFTTDGMYFYHIWIPGNSTSDKTKTLPVNLDCWKVQADELIVETIKKTITLAKKEEGTVTKSLNETILSRLRPYRASPTTATLVTLTGGESAPPSRKEESNIQTSCGLSLKVLQRTPIYCDGSSVIMLSSASSNASSNSARSLFGSASGLSNVRSLATNISFELKEGQFTHRSELIDAPICSLARGATVCGLGICYDSTNNMIWTISNDYVDQFYNPGHQARHHVMTRLGLPPDYQFYPRKDNLMSSDEIIQCLLLHVGSMCLHQITNDMFNSPFGNYLLQQQPIDLAFMRRVCSILEHALHITDYRIIRCALFVLQLIFKVNVFTQVQEEERSLLQLTSVLLWQILDLFGGGRDADRAAIVKEACHVMSAGLHVLYPTNEEQNNLLHKLLTEGDKNPGLMFLRDLIFVNLASDLRGHNINRQKRESVKLGERLVNYILKIAVKESCMLLKDCQVADKPKLETILSQVPKTSPCLQYLMALQSHLLQEAVLYKTDDKNLTYTLQTIQTSVLGFASMLFTGALEVAEVFLEMCNVIINCNSEDVEFRLQGLERVAKATILGHMLPSLLTALTHPNLHCLSMADCLMPQLVQLVLLTSQAALLLKTQAQNVQQDDLIRFTDDVDISELIGDTLSQESDGGDEGFLTGLKIPAPWATGKTIETIHPVRDNYKFKETVHIPGARCLYLRFDGRCATQYDYDKVVIYAGPTTSSKKVAEYGGNTFGYGSRSVLGSGWPKDLVKVDGDTVTFSFEMRSGREHNTPDKAMWGFLVTVRAQESVEEVSQGLPFLADLALGLSVLACTMLHLLYQGPDKTKDETLCEHLLKSKLLQRCIWQDSSNRITMTIQEDTELKCPASPSKLPRIKLPNEILQKLREWSGRITPQIRPSIKEVIEPELLEETIISAVIKHLHLTDSVNHLSSIEEQGSDEYWLLCGILGDAYKRVDALLRQLQVIAALEQRWQMEVDDLLLGNSDPEGPFFIDFHLSESKGIELAMLCFLKDVELEPSNPESSVITLKEKLEIEAAAGKDKADRENRMAKTRILVSGLKERLNLLLQVNISSTTGTSGMLRSASHQPGFFKAVNVMVRSDTDVLQSDSIYNRSLSAPSHRHTVQDDSILDIMRMQRRRQVNLKGAASILQDLVEEETKDAPPHVTLLDQLFSFIGSHPDQAVSCDSFLSAAKIRWKRGRSRKQALIHMKELLTAASRVGGATHLIAAVTSVLQIGPRVEELMCGGMVTEVREAFSETMMSVVQLAARYPIASCNSIGLLCVIPYTRAEEKCLMRSGLVHLLDRLCSLSNYRVDATNTDIQSTKQRVASIAWAGFQVLASRYVQWEQDETLSIHELEHSGLARQVSILLTNHLTCATECSGNEAAGSEALHEILNLLNNLSRSKMGKAILSQPACVSKLLSLLLDQRPSPNLVLIILRLCRVALPLMTAADCEKVSLPSWGQDLQAAWGPGSDFYEPMVRIACLLLAKLGDFAVPVGNVTLSSQDPAADVSGASHGCDSGSDKEKGEDCDVQEGRLSVFLHKRDDQSSHQVIQPLISSDSRSFRISSAANIERIVRMDREMTKNNKAEVTTEDAVSALRKAAKWAQLGLVVSTGPPVDLNPTEGVVLDRKKTASDVICKDKNLELSRTDPIRPFISGHVANNMASEVIALLRSLLTAPETSTAQIWARAVQKVISVALGCLPTLMRQVENMASPRFLPDQMMSMSKQVNAALCALGGFKETIKPGCEVKINGTGIRGSNGVIVSLSEQTGLATVKLNKPPANMSSAKYNDTVQVPLSRLQPLRNQPLLFQQQSMMEMIVTTIQSLLLSPDSSGSPLQYPLLIHGDGNSSNNQMCRVIAEIRTRACMVLAHHLKDVTFSSIFIQHSSAAIETLKSLAKECGPGDRVPVVESHCDQLRMLYRDCAKPPPPPARQPVSHAKEITWDPCRTFPPVRSCLFSQGVTGITFLGDPSAGSGLPRGTLVYASQSIPQQAPSFYWEIEICSFGDSQEESGPIISFGFAPSTERRDGAWTNPVGTCLFHNNGRAVHYNGSSLLQWKSARLEVTLHAGDIAGIGWERDGGTPALPGQHVKGHVYFTHNGRRLGASLDEVAGGMWPIVHVQKKNTRIRANFGARPFAYAEGQRHRNAADECHDRTLDLREALHELPFNFASDSESDGSSSSTSSISSDYMRGPTKPPCRVPVMPKPNKEYQVEASARYKLLPSFSGFTMTGPDVHTQQANQDSESDLDEDEDSDQSEDHYALLVKAWEQKVFPVIRRRFRNEAERKDGLEQIRGALQLGMTDIARQTVEFLYEENGGMPRDLHLPTIEDIREELAKFTIDRVRKGTTVIIRTPQNLDSVGTTCMMVPKFASRSMMKTFGLSGNVLDVDQQNELVLVESYLRSEGILVRYWYPLESLERPPQGYRKAAIPGQHSLDTANVHLHRELLRNESILARMFCRGAFLELMQQCNSPEMAIFSCGVNSSIAASAAVLQDLDIENLQLLSNSLLSPPQPDGCICPTSLLTSHSIDSCLATNSCCLSNLFYNDKKILQRELRTAISRAANQGEDYLIELTTQMCQCLQTAPELFLCEDLPVTEIKVNTDISFPGAAFVVISCRSDGKAVKKEALPYKSPWARFYTYTGHRVKKTGERSKQEVVCYPRDPSSNSNQSEQYSAVMIPTDQIFVRLGVSPAPGIVVNVHGIPTQFPLTMAYLENLVTEKTKSLTKDKTSTVARDAAMSDGYGCMDDASIPITTAVLQHAVELLAGYMWKTNVPAIIKEHIFHLLAQLLRVLHASGSTLSDFLPTTSSHLSPSLNLLFSLQTELKSLYDEEIKAWPSGAGLGLQCEEQGRFTTYFHSLMEVSLAVAEITAPVPSPCSGSGMLSLQQTTSETQSLAPITVPVGGKRKKLKAKRERTASMMQMSPRTSESDGSSGGPSPSSSLTETSSLSSASSTTSVGSSSSGVSITGTKPEEMLWFHRALTLSQILRYMMFKDPQGLSAMNEAVSDAAQMLNVASVHNRLLIITGLPKDLSVESISSTLHKVCHSAGGLFKGEMFLPTDVVEVSVNKENGNKATEDDVVKEKVNGGSESTMKKTIIKGYAVIELRSKIKFDAVRKALFKSKTLIAGLNFDADKMVDLPDEMLSISAVNPGLFSDPQGNAALDDYLSTKLVSNVERKELDDKAMIALTEIFHSCFIAEQRDNYTESKQETGFICLSKDQIAIQSQGNLLYTFFATIRPSKKTFAEHINGVFRQYGIPKFTDKDESTDKNVKLSKKPIKSSKERQQVGSVGRGIMKDKKLKAKETNDNSGKSTEMVGKSKVKDEERLLTLDGFLQFVIDRVHQSASSIWRALLACGFDFHFDRCACLDNLQAQQMCEQWTPEMDAALVQYVNELCRHLATTPSRLHPHELYLTEAELTSEEYSPLQGIPTESVRLRFALIQSINSTLQTLFVPLVDLRPVDSYTLSTANLLSQARHLIFYDTKMFQLNRILNSTAQRKPDQPAPEIVLDPLETVGADVKASISTTFSQAMNQLSAVPSSQLCVRIASGGDPTYSFNVRLTGEEVHGTSGSFRHFLWQVAKELQGSLLDLLILCPTAATLKNRWKYIIKPGSMTYSEEKMLQFIGQLLGIAIRADIPLGLDLLPVFWKNLVGIPLDPVCDLQQGDVLTYKYIKRFEMVESESELSSLYDDNYPRFVYPTITGHEVDLIPDGSKIFVGWDNLQLYIDSIRQLRMEELRCSERMLAIRAGLASVIPLQTLSLMVPRDAQLRTCGLPTVDLDFLKAHTMYQVGLSETDQHIEYFWSVLESFSQDDLCRFIKFACNQDRIPMVCPCRDGSLDTAHVPPYPMKIAPPDGPGNPDIRYIRVETCLFMIKLPQYSSRDIMMQRLLYAVHCREDPLSG